MSHLRRKQQVVNFFKQTHKWSKCMSLFLLASEWQKTALGFQIDHWTPKSGPYTTQRPASATNRFWEIHQSSISSSKTKLNYWPPVPSHVSSLSFSHCTRLWINMKLSGKSSSRAFQLLTLFFQFFCRSFTHASTACLFDPEMLQDKVNNVMDLLSSTRMSTTMWTKSISSLNAAKNIHLFI